MLTVNEIADKLHVNPKSVRRWINQGKLKAVKLAGNVIRIEEVELERFIKGGK